MAARGPSLGCKTCKDGRVKCDLRRPSCWRCVRLRLTCGGYPDLWDTLHRQQNEKAAAQVQKRVEKQSALRQDPVVQPGRNAQSVVLSIPLTRAVDFSANYYSSRKLLSDYTTNSGITVFNSLSQLHSTSASPSFLSALDAAALSRSAGQLNESGLFVQARKSYAMAVSHLRQSMASPPLFANDTLLMSIFLLGLFEFVSQNLPGNTAAPQNTNCHPHATGILTLLQLRIRNEWDTNVDLGVFIFCRHVRLMEVFMMNLPPASISTDFETPWSQWKRSTTLEGPIRQALQAISELRSDIRSSNAPHEEQIDLIARTNVAILSLRLVAQKSTWPSVNSPTFNGLITISSYASAAIVRSLYLTICFHLCEALRLRLANSYWTPSPGSANQPTQCLTDLESCTDELWIYIDDALGTAGHDPPNEEPKTALRMFCLSWPLAAIAQSAFTGHESRMKAIRLLQTKT